MEQPLKKFRVFGVESTITSWYVMAATADEARMLLESGDVEITEEEAATRQKAGYIIGSEEIDDSYIDVSGVEDTEEEGS